MTCFCSRYCMAVGSVGQLVASLLFGWWYQPSKIGKNIWWQEARTGNLSWFSSQSKSTDFLFLFRILYVYFERAGKGGRKRGRETSLCVCLSHVPSWGPGLQPRHVPWLEIKPATLCFAVCFTQSTEPYHPGLIFFYCDVKNDINRAALK